MEEDKLKGAKEKIDVYNEVLKRNSLNEYLVPETLAFIIENTAKDKKSCNSEIERLYCHLLKYYYQSNKQSRSWISTINDASFNAYKFISSNKNVRQDVENNLEKSYLKGRDKAIGETRLSSNIFPQAIPNNWTLDNISNNLWIKDFLIRYAKSDEAKKEVEKYG